VAARLAHAALAALTRAALRIGAARRRRA
jgi:hypothetical protein